MRSDVVKGRRPFFLAMGRTREEMARPLVAVVNSQNELVPGHIHLNEIAAAAREGIIAAGGTPFEFPSIAICDGLAMGHAGMCYPLASRELIADSIEAMMLAHALDAMVLVTNCDKITPGMMMAMARLDVPAILVSGGPMLAGCFQDRAVDVSNLADLAGMAQRGEISAEDREDFIEEAAPTCGACAGLFTANSMNCMAEALGLALPGNGTIPAVYGKRRELARYAGMRVMDLVNEGITPRSVLTREAFENAITVDMAIGGSSNTILHLMAIAAASAINFGISTTWTWRTKPPSAGLDDRHGRWYDRHPGGGALLLHLIAPAIEDVVRLEAQIDGVVAQEALGVDRRRELVVVAVFEGRQVAQPYLGVALGTVQVNALTLAGQLERLTHRRCGRRVYRGAVTPQAAATETQLLTGHAG